MPQDKWDQYAAPASGDKWDQYSDASPGLAIQSAGAPPLPQGIPPKGTLPGNPDPGILNRLFTAAGAGTANLIPDINKIGSYGPLGGLAQYGPLGKQPQPPIGDAISQAGTNLLNAGKGLASPILRAASGDIAGGIGEAIPQVAAFALFRKLGTVPATEEQTAAKLLNASGDISAQTAQNLETVRPILNAAKAAGNAPTTVGQAAQLFKNSSLAIERQISGLASQNAGVNVSPIAKNIADSIRDEALKVANLRPSKASSMWDYADKIEGIRTLSDLDKERELLNGELQSYMKKGNLDRSTLLNDPIKGYKARALENIRDGIANTLSNPLYSPQDLRVLRTQQSALMKLGDVFENASGKYQAQQLAAKGLTGPQKLFQTGAKGLNLVMNPRQAALQAISNPTSAEEFVKSAFRGEPPNMAAGSLVASMLASQQSKKQ